MALLAVDRVLHAEGHAESMARATGFARLHLLHGVRLSAGSRDDNLVVTVDTDIAFRGV